MEGGLTADDKSEGRVEDGEGGDDDGLVIEYTAPRQDPLRTLNGPYDYKYNAKEADALADLAGKHEAAPAVVVESFRDQPRASTSRGGPTGAAAASSSVEDAGELSAPLSWLAPYFAVSDADVLLRAFRACVPWRPLLSEGPTRDALFSTFWKRLRRPGAAPPTPSSAADDPSNDASVARFSTQVDCYGPFWVVTTLVLVLSVSAGLYRFFSRIAGGVAAPGTARGTSDAAKMVAAAGTIYGYWLLVPLFTWLVRRFVLRQTSATDRLPYLVCVYGYAFVPVLVAAAFCLFPALAVDIALMSAGCVISTLCLARNLCPAAASADANAGRLSGWRRWVVYTVPAVLVHLALGVWMCLLLLI
ncbi:hypothetical protein CDCA_CDCA15G4037 [Cyanidium caldarium]|uniref:Protein YIPF n=1 Tax=Cyanidium caldarium TaxID=2771 RepID=A0AAV9J0C1_CYACA|nr:hypothetical protein CDCA_CDCA15G4037 [Cyanidium caldarium]